MSRTSSLSVTCKDCKPLYESNPARMSIGALQVGAASEYQGVELCQVHASLAMAKNRHAKVLGRKGGQARAARLSSDERKKIAKKAARARWKDHINKTKE